MRGASLVPGYGKIKIKGKLPTLARERELPVAGVEYCTLLDLLRASLLFFLRRFVEMPNRSLYARFFAAEFEAERAESLQ